MPIDAPSSSSSSPLDLKYRQANVGIATVQSSGPPSPPLGFAAPIVRRCERRQIMCYHPSDDSYQEVEALMPLGDERSTAQVYKLTGATQLKSALCGEIVAAMVLEWRFDLASQSDSLLFYCETDEVVAIKIDRRKRIRELHNVGHAHPENPWKEISAMQLMGNDNAHVIGLIEALVDDEWLYEVMPFYTGGSLYQLMNHNQQGLDESTARGYFRQILSAIDFMHSKGICHRDISTHNILLNEDQDKCTLIDFGMAVRVPYPFPDDHQTEDVTDVTVGTTRRMIHSQSHCGKLKFMAPEMFRMEDFDGLTVDLWSAGVVLFVLLTGRHPYGKPDPKDPGYHDLIDSRYYWDPNGVDQVFSWGHAVSDEAVDLLKQLFRPMPSDRPTLREISEHPWMLKKDIY
jgi:serine/threonine protein kinase